MKRKFLNIISCFLALFIFVGSFVFCFPSYVSAESYQGNLPDSWFTSIYDLPGDFNDLITALKSNSSLSSFDEFYAFGSYDESNGYYVYLINPINQFTYTDGSGSVAYMGDIYEPSTYYNVNQIESLNYTLINKSVPPQSYEGNNSLVFNTNGNYTYNSTFYYRGQLTNGSSQSLEFLVKISTVYNPEFEEITLPFFSLDVDSFYDWIINNNKLSQLPSYIVQAKLKSFLNFYKQFGSSNTFFVSKIVDWFSHMNIANQSLSNISALKAATDKLYQEYINYRSGTHAYWSGASKIQDRNVIDTHTDNNNLTLVTDDSNDSLDISILRDILRGVIAISNNIIDGVSKIVTQLEHLNFTVNVVNDGGISNPDFSPILNKMDDIINKLVADTVSVEIDQTTQDDTDQFFDDWNLEFSTALNNKFPVAGQLSTLFTDFWDKCGVDSDGDVETFEYYSPGVLTSSVSRSGSAGTSESDIVSDFLGKFDDADPAFLDDSSFHGVPDLSVTVGGQPVSILDFRVYAKYREKIHFIISFVIWTLYLLHLYKALPTIIGQVADVSIKLTDD